MAAEPWKLLLRSWADVAEFRCGRAQGLLAEAAAALAQPMHVADAVMGRIRADVVGNILTEAGTDLAAATASMAAAEIFARRCAAPNPASPLPSIDDLPAAHRNVRIGLAVLQCAKICADEACDRVARCGGRLRTASHLLAHPGVPHVDDIVDAERIAAHAHLLAAQDIAAFGTELAGAAAVLVVFLGGVNWEA